MLLTASNSSLVSPLTFLTISSTYHGKILVSDECLMSVLSFLQQNEHNQNWFSLLSYCVTDSLTFCVESSISTFTVNIPGTCCYTVFANATGAQLSVGFTFRCPLSHLWLPLFPPKNCSQGRTHCQPVFLTVPTFIAFETDVCDG